MGTVTRLGQVAYEAYCNQTGGRSLIDGAELPHWNDLAADVRDAWVAAATAAGRHVLARIETLTRAELER